MGRDIGFMRVCGDTTAGLQNLCGRATHGSDSPRKNDLATAAVIAYDRATSYQETRSVYEDRDPLVL